LAVFDDSMGDGAGMPAFVDWAVASEPGLWRIGYLVTGDAQVTARALEDALDVIYRQWPHLVVATGRAGLDLVVRQELVRALSGTHDARNRRRRRLGVETDERTEDAVTSGVWRAYAGLDLEARAAVVLRYDEHRDLVDIAEVLDREPEAVQQLLTTFAVVASSPGSVSGERSVESVLRDVFDAHCVTRPSRECVGQRILTTARRRRRRHGAVGAFAAVALLAPMAWVAAPSGPDPAAPGTSIAATEDMRWESYGGIEVQVPESWGYGDLTQWCVPAGSPGHVDRPSVDRPRGGATTACSANPSTGDHGVDRPTYTSGLLLRPAGGGPRLGAGDVAVATTIYRRTVRDVELTVVDVEHDLALQILRSAQVVAGQDRNGCPVRTEIPHFGGYLPADRRGVAGMGGAVSATICHYETQPWGRSTLVFSERLDEPGAAEGLRESIRAARTVTAVPPSRQPFGCLQTEAALVALHGFGAAEVWVHHSGCVPQGTDDGHRLRVLTTDVLLEVFGEPWPDELAPGVPGVHTLRT
jgi:hypothetical protein